MITGATSGIGLAAARELARRGADVIAVGRNPEKGARLVGELRRETGNAAVEFLQADLSNLAEVRGLAERLLQLRPRLDVLINNAGAIFAKRRETDEGIEMTLALNLLSPYLLTHVLLPALEKSPGGRIINVSSDAHKAFGLSFDDLENRRWYFGFKAYARSKLGLNLFTYELARRLRLAGSTVTANAVHPGFVATNFGASNSRINKAVYSLMHFTALTAEEGADTIVYVADSPEVEGTSGQYYYGRRPVPPSPASRDAAAARRLWDVCAEMTQVRGVVPQR